jgi:probable addiction module antidote protein
MAKLTKDYKEHLYKRLEDPAEAAEYLNAALEEEDVRVFLLALRDVAEVRGIAKVATKAELNRENLYRILSDQGNPRLSSMLALLRAVGAQLQVTSLSKGASVTAVSARPSLVSSSDEDPSDDEPTQESQIVAHTPEELESEYGSTHPCSNEPVAA